MEFPLDYVRGCFPAFRESRTIYLDNANQPQPLKATELLREPDRRKPSPAEASAALDEARVNLAFFLNASEERAVEEIVFAADVNELRNRLSLVLAESFEPGSEIVVTEIDDEASIAPWLALEEKDVKVRFWPIQRRRGSLIIEELEDLLSDRTRLVAAAKSAAATGTIVELLPLAIRLQDHPADYLIHWTPFLAHGAIDVRFLRADFLIASTRPLFGAELAFLWGRRDRIQSLREQKPDVFDGLSPEPKELLALNAVLGYVEELGLLSQDMQIQPSEDYGRRRYMRRGMQSIRHYERTLTSLLLKRLSQLPKVSVYGINDFDAAALRTPDVLFGVEGIRPAEVTDALRSRHIQVSDGSHGCPRLMRTLGLSAELGAVRASLAHYNRPEEIETFADVLHDIVPR